uniref:EF-hand domain-containing protein n=1 Tax=Ascaris lumbricoides TaxID=6252 RepID=A0A0M3HSL3_ASCLU
MVGAIANCVGIRKESLVIVDRIQKAFNFMCADLDFAEQCKDFSTTHTCHVVDARERAPAAAFQDMFKGQPDASQKGWRAMAVAGELHGLRTDNENFGGAVSWKMLFEPSIEMLNQGVPVSEALALTMKAERESILNESTLSDFVNPATGDVYARGEIMKERKMLRPVNVQTGVDGKELHQNWWRERYRRNMIGVVEEKRAVHLENRLQNFYRIELVPNFHGPCKPKKKADRMTVAKTDELRKYSTQLISSADFRAWLPRGVCLLRRLLCTSHDELAARDTLRFLSESVDPIKDFYSGWMTEQFAYEFQDNGGIITADDFRNYRSVVRKSDEVILTNLTDFIICGPPPPSSSAVAQSILKVVDLLTPQFDQVRSLKCFVSHGPL